VRTETSKHINSWLSTRDLNYESGNLFSSKSQIEFYYGSQTNLIKKQIQIFIKNFIMDCKISYFKVKKKLTYVKKKS
jgi:hypothetical protein